MNWKLAESTTNKYKFIEMGDISDMNKALEL